MVAAFSGARLAHRHPERSARRVVALTPCAILPSTSVSEPVMQGPRPGLRPRHRPPQTSSSVGPLAFLVVVAVIVVALIGIVRPLAEDAAFAYIAEHDTLLKQDIVRTLITARVQNDVD